MTESKILFLHCTPDLYQKYKSKISEIYPGRTLHLLIKARYRDRFANYNNNVKTHIFSDFNNIFSNQHSPEIQKMVEFITAEGFEAIFINNRFLNTYTALYWQIEAPIYVCHRNKLTRVNITLFLKIIGDKFKKTLNSLFHDKLLNLLFLPVNILIYFFHLLKDKINQKNNPPRTMGFSSYKQFLLSVFSKKNYTDPRKLKENQKLSTKIFRRYSTSFWRKLPDFIIPGAARSGTATFYEYLTGHPQLTPALKTEISYFNSDKNYQFGDNWYRCWFPLQNSQGSGQKNNLCFEKSVPYFTSSAAPKRIKSVNKNIKFIILLRDPVERAFSDYHFRGKESMNKIDSSSPPSGQKNKTCFRQALDYELKKLPELKKITSIQDLNQRRYRGPVCFQSGLYYIYLKHWFKYFNREQFLIIKSKNLFYNKKHTLNRVANFLQIDSFTRNRQVHKHEGNYPDIKSKDREELIDLYKPFNQKLYQLLDRDLNWKN